MENYRSIESPYNDFLERDIASTNSYQDPNAAFSNQKGGVSDHSVNEAGKNPANVIFTLEQIMNGEQIIFNATNIGSGVVSGLHLADLVIKNFIQSTVYTPGKSGFKLWGDTGDAEFNDVIVRGNILGIKKNYSDNTAGYFMGKDTDGIYKLYLGDSTTNLKWNGTTLSVTGSITATSGTIGGWTINTTSLTDTAGTVGMSSAVTGGDDIRFWAGSVTPASAPFYVTEAGVIHATSGTIGGNALSATAISSTTFVSGALGSGWNISNTGEAEFQNVTIRGTITSAVFEKSTISAVNGMVLVSPADALASDMTALDASTLTINGETTFSANEVLRIKDGTDDEWMLVTSAASAPTYTVTRDLAGAYTSNNNPVWKAGTAVVSMGVGTGTKTGFVLIDSSSTYSPFIDIYGRNSNTYSDYTIHGRFGWLKGIVDSTVGLSNTDVWGLYTDNAYIKGVIVADSGKIGGVNGWTIGTGKITATGIGVATATGDATYAFWAGSDTPASAEFRVTHAGVMTATGATITGTLTATAGSVGGWTINSTHIYNGATESTAGISLYSSGPTIRLGPSASDERVELGDGSISGYAKNGTDKIYQFLNEATNNNIMSLWKVNNTPSYGNALFISDTSTDDNATLEINASGTGAANKTNILSTSSLTTATDLNVFRATAGTKATIMYVANEGGAVNTVMYVNNDYAGGNAMFIKNSSASNTSACVAIQNENSASTLYIDHNSSGHTIEIDQDANDANETNGITMNIANAGAGVEHAFRFDGAEYDSTSGGNTKAGRIKVSIAGTTRYLYFYSN